MPAAMQSSRVFHFNTLPARKNPNGSESRDVLHGQLPTGEQVALHESIQAAGTPPNPAHRIDHTELICVRSGTLEFHHDGLTERASTGDVLLVAKGTLHSVRNIGDGPAAYFVLAIGGDTNQPHP
ncbi:MAG TPA: cupin domain-containing protein [Acidobacteriaceae bacterium]|jgi:quercetin dioxygenase-like cupin family protein|nr:cupin domain-containing protein [Acidobacteriaceae bacterium]